MTTYWCSAAWLGGPRPEQGVVLEVEAGRIVSGFAEVLAGDRPISDEDRREYASRIHAAAIEIRELVDALLDDQELRGG